MTLLQDRGGDPTDQLPQPTPSPEGSTSNPFADTPSTSPIAIASPSATPARQVDVGQPPPDFTQAVNIALQGRLGLTKYSLIPAADKKALIAKIWQDPTIQSYYTSNHALLATNVSAAGQFGTLINQVMVGQGNDPSVALDYTNMLQAAGVPLTLAEQAGLAGASQAVNAPVPRPFAESGVSGYDYGTPMPAGGWTGTGQSFGWDKHYGVDYGTRAGERIVSPFAGTVTVETNVPGYGNYVTVTLDNGWKIGFGHVAQGSVQNGSRVNPGDLIAIAGANVGSAQGSVTIVTWQDPKGNYQNPHEALDPIFNGTTFGGLGVPNAAGTGTPTVNKILDAQYPSIKSDWTAMFGSPPSPEDVYNVLQHGTSPTQWTDYIRSLPGHIDGMSVGAIYDLRTLADSESMKALGHSSTDGIVKELHDQGFNSQNQIKLWYDQHSPNEIDKHVYNQIVGVLKPNMDGALNESGVDPRMVKEIYDSSQPHHAGNQFE